MNCELAQDKILESFDDELAPPEKDLLEAHLSQCVNCAEFARLQRRLDLRLREQITAPRLSSGFRAALHTRIARESPEILPDWLPDVAYGGGAALGLVLCSALLPFPAPTIIATGGLMAAAVYLLQTLLFTGGLEQPIE